MAEIMTVKIDAVNLDIVKEMYELTVDTARYVNGKECNECSNSYCDEAYISTCKGWRARTILNKLHGYDTKHTNSLDDDEINIIKILVSERYYQLKNEPDTRDKNKFEQIKLLNYKLNI